jgi:hypothetical protein
MSTPTNALEGVLTTTKLGLWIKNGITSSALVLPGRVPAMPNRIIGIVPGNGPGETIEGLFDIMVFNVSCRGGENNFADAEAIAFEVDRLFVNADVNFMIDDVYVLGAGRVGGRPQALPLPDDQTRWTFTCSYYLEVQSGLS